MSMNEAAGRNYGGKVVTPRQGNIPYIHPGDPSSNCKCDMCKKAKAEDAKLGNGTGPVVDPQTFV